MTEFWVSQKNKWCEYCKCWLKDTAQSWAVHERGAGHQENVTRRLREMRLQAEKEKKDEAELARTMERVEAEAQKRYEQDQKAAAAARAEALGEWVWNEAAGYYYNAKHRWYYDKATAMYYGGEPVQWTDSPTMPREARYEVMHAPPPKPPPVAAGGGGTSGAPAAAAAQRPAAGAGARQYAVAGSRISNKHPLSQVGGYQLHQVEGAIGGAKGVGRAAAGGGAADPKRKRDGGAAGGGKEKELSKEDLEFMQRREAARQRVQQRTAASFGLS